MAHDPKQFVAETVLSGLDAVSAAAPEVHVGGVSLAQGNHPAAGPGENYGVPSQYHGPSVDTQPAMVNPSGAGNVSTPGDPVNPTGPTPPMNGPTAERGSEPYPNTTVDLH